jgi:hypothetical protein
MSIQYFPPRKRFRSSSAPGCRQEAVLTGAGLLSKREAMDGGALSFRGETSEGFYLGRAGKKSRKQRLAARAGRATGRACGRQTRKRRPDTEDAGKESRKQRLAASTGRAARRACGSLTGEPAQAAPPPSWLRG